MCKAFSARCFPGSYSAMHTTHNQLTGPGENTLRIDTDNSASSHTMMCVCHHAGRVMDLAMAKPALKTCSHPTQGCRKVFHLLQSPMIYQFGIITSATGVVLGGSCPGATHPLSTQQPV
jgi:hypothetical protein